MKIVRFEERLIDNNLHRFAIYEDGSEEEILAKISSKKNDANIKVKVERYDKNDK